MESTAILIGSIRRVGVATPKRSARLGAWATAFAFVASTLGAVPAAASGPWPAAVATGYLARYLVSPNPLPATNGLALDSEGRLFIGQTFFNRVSVLDLTTQTVTRIADDTDELKSQLQTPDDLALGPDGNVYVVAALTKSVMRMRPDGTSRTPVAVNVTDGRSSPNGIAFHPDGRLFVSDLRFDPASQGGLWQVDPTGVLPAVPVVRGLAVPEGFGFASDGLAYVPEMFAGRIAVVDVDTGSVTRLPTQFDGLLTAAKVMPPSADPLEPLVALEADTGTVWKVDRSSGTPTLLARGEPGLDNLAIATDATIYVSNFARGNIRRVDIPSGTLVPILDDEPLSAPVSLNETEAGDLLVGDLASIARVGPGGTVDRLARFLDSLLMVTPSAIDVDGSFIASDWLTGGRLSRIDLETGNRETVAQGFVVPWHVRHGPADSFLVTDQGLGGVFRVVLGSPTAVPVITGLRSPGGLAYDAASDVIYVSDSDAGTILAVPGSGGVPHVVATDLAVPEGVALDIDGSLLVVEAASGRLSRIHSGGQRSVVAEGLETRLRGITLLPFLNYTSDVVVRGDGTVVISGVADGSLVELRPLGQGIANRRRWDQYSPVADIFKAHGSSPLR